MFKEESLFNKQEKGEKAMKSTVEFRTALDEKKLEEAEKFLSDVASSPEEFSQYDARWLDHRQRELFQAFYKAEDWQGAKRIVEATVGERSKKGRENRLVELSGMRYKEI